MRLNANAQQQEEVAGRAAHRLEKSKVFRMPLNSDLSSKLDYYI